MEFKDAQTIYLQIADYVCEQIMVDKWTEGERIPSVRELGVTLQVNPNTVARTYDFLQGRDIIFNKRGIGYFASDDAKIKINNYLRSKFVEEDLPAVFRSMDLLNIDFEMLMEEYKQYKSNQTNENS